MTSTVPVVRGIYLVGSWPHDSYRIAPDEAGPDVVERLMREPLSLAAPELACLGDGEPGRGYVIYLSESLRAETGIKVARAGDWSGFDDRVVLRRRRPWSRLPALDRHLRYFDFAARSLPVLRRLRAEFSRSDLSLLVGVPSPTTVSGVLFGIRGPLLYRRSIQRATEQELARVRRLGEDVVIQLELTAETVAVTSLPTAASRLLARLFARQTLRLIRAMPSGTQVAVHLCFGSLHGEPGSRLSSLTPLVTLVNALTDGWPADRKLAFVHLPVTTVADVASTAAARYEPLAGLRLPAETELAVGVVRTAQPEAEQLQALQQVAAAVPAGTPLRVSTPCGLLSVSADDAVAAVERAVRLARELGRDGRQAGTAVCPPD